MNYSPWGHKEFDTIEHLLLLGIHRGLVPDLSWIPKSTDAHSLI